MPEDIFRIPDYIVNRKDRADPNGGAPRGGGGVLIAIHNAILFEQTTKPTTVSIETITIQLKTTPSNIVGAVYVPATNETTTTDLDEFGPETTGLGTIL